MHAKEEVSRRERDVYRRRVRGGGETGEGNANEVRAEARRAKHRLLRLSLAPGHFQTNSSGVSAVFRSPSPIYFTGEPDRQRREGELAISPSNTDLCDMFLKSKWFLFCEIK